VRPKTLVALGPVAAAFLTVEQRFCGAAAAGNTRLGSELGELLALDAAHGRDALLAALARASAFGRWHAEDVRSILATGAGAPQPHPAGDALVLELPTVATRSLADYALPDTATGTGSASGSTS